MTTFANQLISGLVLAGPILLLSVSLSTVLASARVLNVAIGAAYSLFAIVAVRYEPDVGAVGFVLVVLLAPVVLFVAMELLVLLPQRARSADPEMASFAATLGVSLILTAAAGEISGGAVVSVPTNFIRLAHTWTAGGVLFPENGLIVVGIAVVLAGLYGVMLAKTRFGVKIRATALDPLLARSAGIIPNRVILSTWAIAGLLAGVATLLLLLVDRSVSTTSGGDLLLTPFAAVIAGGMGSALGASIASVCFGLAESFATNVSGSAGVQSAIVFGLLFVVLVLRPEGLIRGHRGSRAY